MTQLNTAPTARTIISRPRSWILASAAVAFSVLSVAVPAASAKSGGSLRTSTTNPPMSLSSETIQWNPQLTNVSCLTEDDYDQRVFTGSLNGSYSTSYQLCDLNKDGLTAGGIGLQSRISAVGQVSDIAITAPNGSVHHAVPLGYTTSKGVTTYYYETCFMPLFYKSTDTGTAPLPGGTWQITLSGQLSSATWTTNAEMGYVHFQESYCPTSEQNLAP